MLRRLRKKPQPCENCGHVEQIYFVCPACGASFEVRSETSARIFCSHECIRLDRKYHQEAVAS